MDNLRGIFMSYISTCTLFTLVFLLLFRTPLFADQHILFYRGIGLLVVTFVIGALIIALYSWYVTTDTTQSLIAALVTSAAIHLAIFVVFPVTFDRSVTMYLLNTLEAAPLQNSCHGYSATELEELLIKEYVQEHGAIARRIKEQSIIDMLTPNNACVSLTERGSRFLEFSRTVGWLYNLNQ